jgi:hypothetical protein
MISKLAMPAKETAPVFHLQWESGGKEPDRSASTGKLVAFTLSYPRHIFSQTAVPLWRLSCADYSAGEIQTQGSRALRQIPENNERSSQ